MKRNSISNRENRFRPLLGVALMCLVAGWCASCQDVWENHYDPSGQQNASDKTLWEEICAHPELASFRALLEQTGSSALLDADQMFTVFAPQGAIDSEGLSAAAIESEIIGNHVARFAHSASPSLKDPENMLMLNNKRGTFAFDGSTYTFTGQPLVQKNIICKNGVLHMVAGQVPFFSNVWEYMSKSPDYSSICDYLYSFDELVLDEESSVAGAVVDGKITYVDSVTVNYNEMLYRLGRLNDEDSTYYMILPTNAAWEKAVKTISGYYTYPYKNTKRDSLQAHFTQRAMVDNLVFSASMQHSPADSVVSTTKNVFYRPFETLLPEYAGFDSGVECSNGRVFPVDTLRHHAWESWHTRLKVEGEETRGREYTSSELYRRTLNASSPFYGRLSGNTYLEAIPTTSSANPNVTFTVANTLSAKYDIKVVFLPQTLSTDRENVGKPNNVQCTLYYVDENGKSTNVKSGTVNPDPDHIDTLTIFSAFAFPACEYAEEVPNVKLKLASSVSSKQRASYSRTLLVDCVILEPTKETEE